MQGLLGQLAGGRTSKMCLCFSIQGLYPGSARLPRDHDDGTGQQHPASCQEGGMAGLVRSGVKGERVPQVLGLGHVEIGKRS